MPYSLRRISKIQLILRTCVIYLCHCVTEVKKMYKNIQNIFNICKKNNNTKAIDRQLSNNKSSGGKIPEEKIL